MKKRVSDKSKQNLIMFKPGQSGNPKGKPVGSKNLTTILKELLDAKTPYQGKKIIFKEAIVRKLLLKAKGGDMRAIQEIFDRIEGKARQEMIIEGIPNPEITVKIKLPTDTGMESD